MAVCCSPEIMDKCKYSTASVNRKKHHADRRICEYILITGHSRPCHWKECTVFAEREKKCDRKG